MGLIISPQEQIDAYFASEDLSQSHLKDLLTGIDKFTAEREDISSKPYIQVGKAVDMILTGHEDEFEKTYYISEAEKKPTEAVANIIQGVFDKVKEDYEEYLLTVTPVNDAHEVTQEGEALIVGEETLIEEEIPVTSFIDFAGRLEEKNDYIIWVARNNQYQARWGDEAIIKAILTAGTEYYIDLTKSFGKTIIDANTSIQIQSIVTSLRTNLRTAKFFDRYDQQRLINADVILQMPIFFEYEGIKCKALLDMVIVIRDEEGRILQVSPYDLKTMNGNTYNFLSSIKSYRYDIQGVWYSLALFSYYGINRSKLDNFRFIVESTSIQGKPLVYELSNQLMDMGMWGRPELQYVDTAMFAENSDYTPTPYITSPEIKGVYQLIEMYKYHQENGWEVEKEIQESDKEGLPLVVNWNGFLN